MLRKVMLVITAVLSFLITLWSVYCLYIRIQWELAPVRYPGLAELVQPAETVAEIIIFSCITGFSIWRLIRIKKRENLKKTNKQPT